jgi:ubiquinone biosynthesis protein
MPRPRLTFRNAKRLEEIIMVLVRFGFSDWVSRLHLGRLARRLAFWRWGRGEPAPGSVRQDSRTPDSLRWQRFRLALEELGPTFIKFGQIMANRADLMPAGLIVELEKLQDQVPPFGPEQVTVLVEAELGAPLASLFSSFNTTPVASASIAQVHEARLHDGRRVALKVQRPDIQPVIERDLEVLGLLARLVVRYVPDLRHFNPPGLVEEFRRQIMRELDFAQELSHMDSFARLFRGTKTIHVPSTYPKFSTRRVLCMEFIQGTKLSAVLSGGNSGFDRSEIARRLADLMLEQVFWHGFFHADPHPGNVMILEGEVICFLDFGMMGRINLDEQKMMVDLLASLVERDYRHVTGNLLRLFGHSVHEDRALETEIGDILDRYFELPLGELDFGEVFQRLVIVVQNHALNVPSKYLLMAKALVIAEGVGSQLSPEFSFMNLFGPFARRLALRRLRPDQFARTIWQKGEDYAELLREFPGEGLELLQAMRRGEFTVNFRLRGAEPLRQTIESVGTRLVFGLVLAAILISSSLIIRAGIAPFLYGVPLVGLIGFGIAAAMSFGFLLIIIRHMFHKTPRGE